LRFDVPGLRGAPWLAAAIEAELQRFPGIESVEANVASGRLLICYGPDESGKLSMNFGPLNRDGGERRIDWHDVGRPHRGELEPDRERR
jgi:hypothetical protein